MATLGNTPRPAYVYDTETDTWVPIGVGAHTHDTLYVNQNIIDAKGDLIVGTADNSYDRLAAGNSGDTLVADSSATTGLRWQGNFAAGKNKIINGDFNINQRAFTSTTGFGAYSFDRWVQFNGGTTGTLTITPQTFTPGTAPVAGYEGKNFVQCVTAAGASADTFALYVQKVESVRTLAGQTATVSFWAKAASGTPKIAVEISQSFGSGGGASAEFQTPAGAVTLSTSWARYSVTVAIPSISGKTIGTNNDDSLLVSLWFSAGSNFNARTSSIGLQNATFQIWGVQAEAGSVATPFTTATGTLAGELAACSRYYYRVDSANANDTRMQVLTMAANSTTTSYGNYIFPVRMRTSPSFAASTASGFAINRGATTCTAVGQERSSVYSSMVRGTVASGLTVGQADWLEVNGNNTAYIEFNAEL